MNSRERWTVYPLLFLALGLAVRAVAIPAESLSAAKVNELEALRLTCREIIIHGDDGTVLVRMGRVEDAGGRIEIKDQLGRNAIAIGTRSDAHGGGVEYFDADGNAVGTSSADSQADGRSIR